MCLEQMSPKFTVKKNIDQGKIIGLCIDGLISDGIFHKQWHLESILKEIVEDFESIKQKHNWLNGTTP